MSSIHAPPTIPNQVLSGIQPGTNVIIIQGYAPTPSVYPRYNGKASKALGITQIVLGALSILLTALSMYFEITLAFIGSGIWCAVMYFIAGAFGIAAKGQERCKVITHMVLSIIAAVLSLIPFALAVSGGKGSVGYSEYYDNTAQTPLNAILAIVSFAELVTAVMASVLCFKGAFSRNAYDVQPQPNVPAGASGAQHTVTENNQFIQQQLGPCQPCPAVNMPYAVQPQPNVPAGASGAQYTVTENNQFIQHQLGPDVNMPYGHIPPHTGDSPPPAYDVKATL